MGEIIITIPPEIEAKIRELQKEYFSNETFSDVYEKALSRGLELAIAEKEKEEECREITD